MGTEIIKFVLPTGQKQINPVGQLCPLSFRTVLMRLHFFIKRQNGYTAMTQLGKPTLNFVIKTLMSEVN
jgi:hypothetical protein